MRSRLVRACLVVLASFAVPVSADPLLHVASFHVRLDKEAQFVDLVKKYDQPMFAKLLAEGAVLAWGLDSNVLHDPAGPTHHLWWISADNAGLEKTLAAEEAMGGQMEADDAKAAQAAKAAGKPVPKPTLARILETIDFAKHQDSLYRILSSDARPPAAGTKPYIQVTFARIPAGKDAEFRAAWDKYVKSVTDKLMADGTLIGYGLGTASPRTDAFTHVGWVTFPSLAARDKYTAAFAGRSPSDAKDANEAFTRTVDGDATRGVLLRSILYEMGAPPSR